MYKYFTKSSGILLLVIGALDFGRMISEILSDNTSIAMALAYAVVGVFALTLGFYWVNEEHEDKKMELIDTATEGWGRALIKLKEATEMNLNLKLELRKTIEENRVLRAKKSKK